MPPLSKPTKLNVVSLGEDGTTHFVVINVNNKKTWVPLSDCDCVKVRNGRTFRLEYSLKHAV